MKNNAPRNFIFNCHRPLSVLLLGVVVPHAQVNADVPPPPPVQHQNAGFPSAQKLEQMGYNRETGVWKVQTNPTGKPTVSSGGGQITGKQGQRVTVTDGYGNKATVNTQVTQYVGVGKLQTAANVAVVGATAGGAFSSAVEKYGDSIAYYWKKGDYENFINTVILASGHATDVLTGGFFSSSHEMARKLGWSDTPTEKEFQDIADSFYQYMRKREDAGDFSGAVGNAAAAKAAEAAAEAAQKAQQQEQQRKEEQKKDEEAKKNGMIKYQLIVKVDGSYQNYVFYSKFGIDLNGSKDNTLNNSPAYLHRFVSKVDIDIPNSSPSRISVSVPSDRHVYVYYNSYKEGTVPESEKQKIAQNESQVKPEDFMLTQKEMLDILKRMLENNQTNHAELMNQLAKMGNVVPDSTTSTEFTPATATTAPYTPSGSNTPQQTKITINRDGSVTTSVIPRPDLVPNSPQAPTRSPLIPNNPSIPTTPTSPNNPSTPTTPDNSTMPNKPKENQPPQENTAYEDPDIPTQTVDLDFKPADIFSVDGVCPEPRTVDFGMFGQHEFSYNPLCDFARKLRPILILITIVSCSFFVYSSLKD
ncbi:virulence factor TspB C-terminal domain-related protein [Neisseria sp.]